MTDWTAHRTTNALRRVAPRTDWDDGNTQYQLQHSGCQDTCQENFERMCQMSTVLRETRPTVDGTTPSLQSHHGSSLHYDWSGFCWSFQAAEGTHSETCRYACFFVCMSTKCVHIELVMDMTTDSFLAALRRFVARRGRPNRARCTL